MHARTCLDNRPSHAIAMIHGPGSEKHFRVGKCDSSWRVFFCFYAHKVSRNTWLVRVLGRSRTRESFWLSLQVSPFCLCLSWSSRLFMPLPCLYSRKEAAGTIHCRWVGQGRDVDRAFKAIVGGQFGDGGFFTPNIAASHRMAVPPPCYGKWMADQAFNTTHNESSSVLFFTLSRWFFDAEYLALGSSYSVFEFYFSFGGKRMWQRVWDRCGWSSNCAGWTTAPDSCAMASSVTWPVPVTCGSEAISTRKEVINN